MKDFSRRLAAEDDAGAVVQTPLRFGDLAFCDGVKVDAFGEILADEAVHILDRAALPGAMGIAEVDGDLGGEGEGGVSLRADYVLSVPSYHARPGMTVRVPVQLNNATDLAGVLIRINYAPQMVTVLGVSAGGLGSQFTLSHTDADGVLTLMATRPTKLLSGSGTLAILELEMNDGAEAGDFSELVLAQFDLSDETGVNRLDWANTIALSSGRLTAKTTGMIDNNGDRIRAFDRASLVEVGKRVRDIFVSGSKDPSAVSERANDELVETLADAVTGELGGKVGIAPRLFLKKWVADLLDRIELYRDFDPRKDYRLTLRGDEMIPQERNMTGAASVEDIPLDV